MIEASMSGGSSSSRVKLNPLEIKGEGCRQYPRLQIPIRIAISPPHMNTGDNMKSLVVAARCGLHIDGFPHRIADGILIDMCQTIYFDQDGHLRFDFPLDGPKIALLEDRRRGDMKLRLDINLSVLAARSVALPSGDGKSTISTYIGTSPHPLYGGIECVVPQSKWVKDVLPAWEYHQYFLVEIPRGPQAIEAAWKYVEKAESAFIQWDIKSVAGNCREVGKVLDGAVRAQLGSDDLRFTVKWGRARERFEHSISWALHLEDIQQKDGLHGRPLEANKADGEFLLLSTKALVKYAEELMASGQPLQ